MNFNEWVNKLQENDYEIVNLSKIFSLLGITCNDDEQSYDDDNKDLNPINHLTCDSEAFFLVCDAMEIEEALTIEELEEIYKIEFENDIKENIQYTENPLTTHRREGFMVMPINEKSKKNKKVYEKKTEKVKLDKKIQENITQDLFNKYQSELFKLCKTYEDQLGNTDINTIIEHWKYPKNSLYVVLFRLYNAYAIELLTYPDSKEFNFNGHYGSHLRRKMQ